MLYYIKDIEFDFETDEGLPSKKYQKEITSQYKGKYIAWETDMEEITDWISDNSGWCINSIDISIVKKEVEV